MMIAKLICFLIGVSIGIVCMYIFFQRQLSVQRTGNGKLLSFYRLLNKWLALKQKGEMLSDYFIMNGYEKVAIYGKKELGDNLRRELYYGGIEVTCFIDRDAEKIYSDLPIFRPDQICQMDADVIVVTAVYYYDEIFAELKGRTDCPIVSLWNVVNCC